MLDKGNTWMKLSGAYMFDGPPRYAKAAPIAQAYIKAAPERMVWGSDWPHPTEKDKPDDAVLFDLLSDWAPDAATRQRILVDNPATLYGFPKELQAGGTLMDIKPLGSQPSRKTPADYFTGTVWQDPIIEAPEPARLRAAWVRFEPGARTAWHTHPLGQTIHITQGEGRVQIWGGPIKEVRAGDTVFFAPNEKHWHGAAPNTAMTHLAMQEALDGTHVTWMEKVSRRAVRRKGRLRTALTERSGTGFPPR